ncbi:MULTISPECIES: hypothetical protein [unclassified Pseudonocardia]|nr:hypothetical protein [Pseudonocardia sp. ICBG601]
MAHLFSPYTFHGIATPMTLSRSRDDHARWLRNMRGHTPGVGRPEPRASR